MGVARSQCAEAAAGTASRGDDRRPAATLDSPALLARLHQDLLTNPATELALTRARRHLCLDPSAAPTPLAAAITAQGSLNEYVWSVTEEECSALASAPAWVRAMYGPTLADPELLQRAQRIPALTEVTAGTSTAVRKMYEENPYPRWHRLNHRSPLALGQSLRELTGGEFDPPDFFRQPRLLVAGCGTGREMLTAAKAWRPASVTGFDLSRVSLAYAQMKAEQLGVEIDLYQADLLELGEWDRRFDAIACTGVLHHLDDPVSGWRALVRLLRPGGVMLVGLYSRQARAGIRVAQADVRRAGWQPTPAGIRHARAHIMELPREHPGRDCTRLGDFYSLSGCRDMLFHVREHDFILPEVAEALEDVPGISHVAIPREMGAQESANFVAELAQMLPLPDSSELRLHQSAQDEFIFVLPLPPDGASSLNKDLLDLVVGGGNGGNGGFPGIGGLSGNGGNGGAGLIG